MIDQNAKNAVAHLRRAETNLGGAMRDLAAATEAVCRSTRVGPLHVEHLIQYQQQTSEILKCIEQQVAFIREQAGLPDGVDNDVPPPPWLQQ